MKLFGSCHDAEHVSPSGRRRLTGVQKGVLLLALAVCILAATVFGI